MEDDNSTQYTCSNEDNLQFSSQTQKKKHGMILNLGTKTHIFGDQTPTPTRFIRNCEEVGLFQDLQNVNPFEETFRKAVEAGKTTSADFQSPNSSGNATGDDTLHTPHIFPHIIGVAEKPVSGVNPSGTKEEDKGRQAVKVIRQEADTSQHPITKCNISVVVDSASNDTVENDNMISTTPGAVQVILRMLSDSQLVQLRQKKNESEQPLNTMLMETAGKSGNNSVIIHTKPDKEVLPNKLSLAKQKLKCLLRNHSPSRNDKQKLDDEKSTSSKATKTKRNSRYGSIYNQSQKSNVESEEDIKRKKFLERNRAAAMRCRERRKSWVADLERRAEQMLNTNQQLQLEVASLKAEVAQLKTLLLAHKDCPVTLAMSQGNIPAYVIDAVVPRLTTESTTTKTTSSTIYLTSPQFKKKQTSIEDMSFRQNLRKRLCTSKSKASEPYHKLPAVIKSQEKNPSLSKCDEYLSSVLITNSNSTFNEFDTFVTDKVQHIEKPVATQVIQFNPNVLHRQNSLRLPSGENEEEPIIQNSSPSNVYS